MASCTSPYKRAGNGIEYKIVSDGNGKKLSYGNFFEFHMKQMYKNGKVDTLTGDTRDYMPRMDTYDSSTMPPAYLNIFRDARNGDSIVVRMLTDSAYKQDAQQMPAYMTPGGYIYTTVRILNIFENRYQADSAGRAELRVNGLKIYSKLLNKFEKEFEKDKTQIEADSKTISTWLDKNNIKYTRGKWGTFIVVHDEGIGEKIAFNNVIAVNYTGRSLDSGKVFDSNIDPKFKHVEPLEVTMSHLANIIPGWTDALMQLKNGAKATIYIPSSLGYGKKGKLPGIRPNENLIFEIEVINMITEDHALEAASETRRRDEEARRKLLDSLKNVK